MLDVQFGFWYRVSPFGPPQVKLEFPEHGMLQGPSVAGTLPDPRTFPQ